MWKNLKELLASLTEQEKEQFAELIEETKKRDEEIKQSNQNTQHNLLLLEQNIAELNQVFVEFYNAMRQCQIEFQKLSDSIENLDAALALKNIPDEKFEKV